MCEHLALLSKTIFHDVTIQIIITDPKPAKNHTEGKNFFFLIQHVIQIVHDPEKVTSNMFKDVFMSVSRNLLVIKK